MTLTPEQLAKSREEFEDWFKSQYTGYHLKRFDGDGRYQTLWIQYLWRGWQASRESLVVELPEAHQHYYADESQVEDETFLASEIENMLQSAGINYTERER